jgi:cbb3-type cytochrome oxidase subunit 1
VRRFNAVAFFHNTFLGLMYYFVPKAANRPVYSIDNCYLVLDFIYIWLDHHLLYSALPNWAQTWELLSIMLLAFLVDDKWFANVAWCLGCTC